jgi:hypothetical protein
MMHVFNLYADTDGQSHSRDVEIEFSERRLSGLLSKAQTVGTLMFREVPPGVFLDWLNAPDRRYALVLNGPVQFTASDGKPVYSEPVTCCWSRTPPEGDTKPRASMARHSARSL